MDPAQHKKESEREYRNKRIPVGPAQTGKTPSRKTKSQDKNAIKETFQKRHRREAGAMVAKLDHRR